MRDLGTHGLMAEFHDADELVAAARRVREAGYRYFDAYTPYPVEELEEAMGLRHTRLPFLVLLGGIAGGAAGFFLQVWTNLSAYPLNVGGRPLFSWPSFIPVTFECIILAAGVTAVLGMLALNGLPQPYHPVFNVSRFALASRDRFFLCVEARDERFDAQQTRKLLEDLNAREVSEVDA